MMALEKLQKKHKKWMVQLRDSLYQVKESYNLENVTLLHRTGGPLESAGNWQSRNEIFGLCAAVINITNYAMDVFLGEIRKYFIDLGRRKVLVVPLQDTGYTILITAATEINNPTFLAMLDDSFLPSIGISIGVYPIFYRLCNIACGTTLRNGCFEPFGTVRCPSRTQYRSEELHI